MRRAGRNALVAAWLILVSAAGLSDSAKAQAIECHIGKPQQVAELFFGRKVGDRVGVSNAAWARFVDREITPRFPDGFTVIEAKGQWRDAARNAILRESSKVVQIVLPGNGEDLDRLAAITQAYKQRFRQQSVAVLLRPACVAF
ncbi:MAG TPA: DUF3574 domain-containing protein [Sphingomonas sp.]|nr:DUF3574 domain-containing protein [Sphingomonas sp.]